MCITNVTASVVYALKCGIKIDFHTLATMQHMHVCKLTRILHPKKMNHYCVDVVLRRTQKQQLQRQCTQIQRYTVHTVCRVGRKTRQFLKVVHKTAVHDDVERCITTPQNCK